MELKDTNSQKKEIFLEKYPYLKPLLKHYKQNYDIISVTMDDYIVFLNRVILKYQKHSDLQTIDAIKNLFFILIKNSIRMNRDGILLKSLSYFLKEGFDFLIFSLKSDRDIKRVDFINKLFSILDQEKIAPTFNLNKTEVENELKLTTLKKAIRKKKFIFNQKIGSFIFLFFRNLIELNDKEIKGELFKFIKEEDWSEFYKAYEEFKKFDDFERKVNTIFSKENLDKNEIKENKGNDIDVLDNLEDPQNSEEKSTEPNNGNSEQKSIETNKGNNDQKSTETNIRNENMPDEKEIKVLNNKELTELIIGLKSEIESMKKTICVLSDKLDLSILINNLSTQRDCYKKTLEILLKYLNNELELNLVLVGDDIWNKTKTAINKIYDCGLSEETSHNIINALKGLLFCKDYANILTHGKNTFSDELNDYYKEKKDEQIISTASYENMKTATKMFFNKRVNEGGLQIINNILFQKIEKWKSENQIDYSQYISKNKLDYETVLKHFSFAENIIERFALNEIIDNSLLYK